MSKLFRINFASQPSMFDIQFYRYKGDDLMPIQSECYSFDREQLSELRDCIDSHLGDNKAFQNWPPVTLDEMRRAVAEMQAQINQMKNPN